MLKFNIIDNFYMKNHCGNILSNVNNLLKYLEFDCCITCVKFGLKTLRQHRRATKECRNVVFFMLCVDKATATVLRPRKESTAALVLCVSIGKASALALKLRVTASRHL